MPLTLTPLPERDSLSDFPFQYNMGIGVRRRDKEFRDSLEAVLDAQAPEIQAILKQFNVPVFPIVEENSGDATEGGPTREAHRLTHDRSITNSLRRRLCAAGGLGPFA